MKIGILGGTFDPIHNGHLIMAAYALGEYNLDKIMFLPNSIPPHKNKSGFSTDDERLKMIEIAISSNSAYFVSDYELKKGGKSYTSHTLSHFVGDGNEYYFIIGADSFYQIMKWYESEKLIKMCTFLVANRTYNDKVLLHEIENFNKKYNVDFRLLCMPKEDISSTDIRKYVSEGKSIDGLVPFRVQEYIIENNLYTKKED